MSMRLGVRALTFTEDQMDAMLVARLYCHDKASPQPFHTPFTSGTESGEHLNLISGLGHSTYGWGDFGDSPELRRSPSLDVGRSLAQAGSIS